MNRTFTRVWHGTAVLLVGLLLGALALASVAAPANAAPYGGYKSHGATVNSGRVMIDGKFVCGPSKYFISYQDNGNGEYTEVVQPYPKGSFAGVSYSKKTNTLTLKGTKLAKKTLDIRGMGSDFKIKIVGKNQVGNISGGVIVDKNGKAHPTSIKFTGKGSLLVNKRQLPCNAIDFSGGSFWTYNQDPDTYEPLLNMFVGGTKTKIAVGKGVKIQLWASKGYAPIKLSGTTIAKSGTALVAGKSAGITKTTSKKYAGWKECKHPRSIVDVAAGGNAVKDNVYRIEEDFYVIATRDGDDADMYPVRGIAEGLYLPNYKNVQTIVDFVGQASEVFPAKVICENPKAVKVYGDAKELAFLNGTKFVGMPAKGAKKAKTDATGASLQFPSNEYNLTDSALGYWDKWVVYENLYRAGGVVYAKKVGSVKGSGALPKGYTGNIVRTYKRTYTYTFKGSHATIVG